jgi:hypothetical protein
MHRIVSFAPTKFLFVNGKSGMHAKENADQNAWKYSMY